MTSVRLLDLAALFLVVLFTKRFLESRKSAKLGTLLPGPKGWPIIGNALEWPTSHEWLKFAKWGETYGDIMSATLFKQRFVILNSGQRAIEMLEKKSVIYSDRPTLLVAGELIGWVRALQLCRPGPRLREIRRLFASSLGTRNAMTRYSPLVENQTRRCMLRLLQAAGRGHVQVEKPVRKTAGGIILAIAFGYRVSEQIDAFVNIADAVMEEFSIATSPGQFLVDIVPIMRFIPRWLPGGTWKKKAAAWGKNFEIMSDEPFDFVKEQMAAGTAAESFLSTELEKDVDPVQEEILKMTAHAMYTGGADTTVSSNSNLVLMMMLHPEIQKKAQAELDAVIGQDRFPTIADRDQLPYISALCWELLRWHPVAPLGLPHRVSEDDVHAGYYISEGTLVIANIWQILHDQRIYSDPFTFNPERFLPSPGKEPERDPGDFVFGFGRRICPGSHLANISVFAFCATLLSVFDITAPEGAPSINPREIEYTTGTVSHPPPFECCLKPRSPEAEALIRSISLDEYED